MTGIKVLMVAFEQKDLYEVAGCIDILRAEVEETEAILAEYSG